MEENGEKNISRKAQVTHLLNLRQWGRVKNKKIFLVYGLISLLLMLWISDVVMDRTATKRNTEKEVSGIVGNKYKKRLWGGNSRDESPMLRIDDFAGSTEFNILGWCRGGSTFWEYVEIGDKVSKPSGTLQLKIVKPSGETKLFKYYSATDIKKKKRFFW